MQDDSKASAQQLQWLAKVHFTRQITQYTSEESSKCDGNKLKNHTLTNLPLKLGGSVPKKTYRKNWHVFNGLDTSHVTHSRKQQEGLAVASIARDVVV